ncbi:MAG: hypothetical protein R2856_17920 [Caldilineaceae bacterium]
MTARYRAAPENLLYAAWFYRLQEQADDRDNREDSVSWRTAAAGAAFWFVICAAGRFALRLCRRRAVSALVVVAAGGGAGLSFFDDRESGATGGGRCLRWAG